MFKSPLFRTSSLAVLLVFGGFLLAYQFVKPAPPSSITMATGSVSGGYHAFGIAMQERLAQEGIRLELRNSAGSAENAALLSAGEVDLALMQGGTATADEQLRGLASLYFEPLWVFVRAASDLADSNRLQQLAGKRISIGAPGSGTRALATQLLSLNRMTLGDSDQSGTGSFVELSTAEAAVALQAGKLDGLFAVGGASSPEIDNLLRTDGVALLDLARAPAYHLQLRYLSELELPAGAIDLAADRPPDDRRLIGVAAMLVAGSDLHPALVDLLLLSAPDVVGGDGLFQRAGEFPSAEFLSLPIEDEAKRFHARGPSFLQRYLPFWAATLVDRLIVMLVPLIAVVLPLMRLFPPIYRWRVRSRIYRWYADLKDIEARVDAGENSLELAHAVQSLEDEVKRVETPLSYADELYHLRGHIELVQARIDGNAAQPS